MTRARMKYQGSQCSWRKWRLLDWRFRGAYLPLDKARSFAPLAALLLTNAQLVNVPALSPPRNTAPPPTATLSRNRHQFAVTVPVDGAEIAPPEIDTPSGLFLQKPRHHLRQGCVDVLRCRTRSSR